MLKQHKNAFLEAIQKSGLDPTLFSTSEIDPLEGTGSFTRFMSIFSKYTSPVFTIVVTNTPISFSVRHIQSSFYEFHYRFVRFKPGFPDSGVMRANSVEEILREFNDWLMNAAAKYIEDNQVPDFWEQIELYKSFVSSSTPRKQNASEFTEEEKDDLRRSVQQFRHLIIENFEPSEKQTEFIDEQLDYLSKAVDRLNRFDWRSLALSIVISIAINLSVDTEKGRLLFRLFQQAFQLTVKLLQ
jgi:hypothetical protein